MQQSLNKIIYLDDPGMNSPDRLDEHAEHEENQITDEVLKSLINISTDVITVLNPEGTVLYESDSIKRMLGYDKDELVGQNAFTYIHKDDLKKVYSDFMNGLSSPGKSIITSFRFRKADGSYIFLGCHFTY